MIVAPVQGRGSRWSAFVLIGTALLLWATACVASEGAEALLVRAREAAAGDRHREAIDLYLRAVAADPVLRSSVSIELGHQYTWAEMPDSAIAWYEIYLRENPGDIDARIGIARALSWSDRLAEAEAYYADMLADAGERRSDVMLGLAKTNAWQEDYGEAERIYREILSADSANTEAKVGLGETLNDAGKHRAAARVFGEVLAADGENKDAVTGLARAEMWNGRPDRALETLQRALENEVRNDEAGRMADGIRGMLRPRAEAGFDYRENRDDGVIRTGRVSLTWPIDYLTEVGAAYARSVLHKLGYPDIDRHEFSLYASRRFSDGFAATVAPGYELNRFDPIALEPGSEDVDRFDLMVWDAYVTLNPRDWMRIDAGTSREAMDIPLPVFKRIHVTTENAGLDWRLAPRLATFWEVKYSAYSDGNSRTAASERVEWASPWRIPLAARNRVALIQGLEFSSFAKQPDNGYFSPRSHVYAYGGARFVFGAAGPVSLTLDGRLGGEKEDGNGWASVGALEVALRGGVAREVSLAGGYFKSGSRLDSPDGFRAEGFFLMLEYGGER